jgi:hypothetical protein
MWADALLAAERAHLVRLLLWGGASLLGGTMLITWLLATRREGSLLRHFAIQTAAWGGIDVAICAFAWNTLALRDLRGAVQLDRFLWLNVGLDAGYVLVGATLAIAGHRLGRRMGMVGAGIGVIVQGIALLLLDLMLAGQIDRVG